MKIACITPDNKRDYLCEMVLEGLSELGHQLVVSDPGNGFCKHSLIDGSFREELKSSDLLLCFFGKVRGNRPPRRYFVADSDFPRDRTVYIDGSEWSATGWESGDQTAASLTNPSRRRGEPWLDEEMLKRCGHYFKRETYAQDLARDVVPFPFAMCDRHVVMTGEKDIDVLCSLGHTKTGMRKEAIEVVQNFRDTTDASHKLNIVVRSDLSSSEYKDHLRRARIVVDAWGGGDTCDRFWEAVGARACVLYQRYNVEFPHPFLDFEHAVSWSTPDELSKSIHHLVFNDANPELIGERGLEHAMCYHTAKNRAQQILDTVFAR